MDAVNELATGGFADIVTFVTNFLAFLVIAGALFAFSLRAGRAALITLIVSLYAGYALYAVFPYKDVLESGEGTGAFAAHLLMFVALTAFPYVLIRRITTSGFMRVNGFLLFGLCLLTAGFILAIGYHLFGLSGVFPLSSSLDALFAPDKYFFWWFVAPLVGVFVAAR
jgi:hypothetical protein